MKWSLSLTCGEQQGHFLHCNVRIYNKSRKTYKIRGECSENTINLPLGKRRRYHAAARMLQVGVCREHTWNSYIGAEALITVRGAQARIRGVRKPPESVG